MSSCVGRVAGWTARFRFYKFETGNKLMPKTSASSTHLKFLCFGVGAIGTYIGGSLLLSGQQVIFLDRPAVAEDLRQKGLRLGLKDGEANIADPIIVTSLDEALRAGPFDAAIFAVKSFDTPGLLESIAPYRAALPPFLCLQNGVENEPQIAAKLGEDKVIAGTVTTAIGRRGPGDIVVEKLRGVGIALDHTLAPTLVDIFDSAGLRCRAYRYAAAMKWSKMITNLLANASSAILDMSPLEIFNHPGLFHLEMRMLREALGVMTAKHLRVVDLPGTPVHLLTWMAQNLPESVSRPIMAQTLGKGRGGKMPSFHIDLYAGRTQSEVEFLNGAVVKNGSLCSVPTPVNRFLTETLLALVRQEMPKEHFARQPEKFLAALEAFEGEMIA
jgi:2-dehydropantoate 2-reductase